MRWGFRSSVALERNPFSCVQSANHADVRGRFECRCNPVLQLHSSVPRHRSISICETVIGRTCSWGH